MTFTFAARTLIELGKELISSDEVAFYELIKNAVDAGSERVELSATIRFTRSAYREALEASEDGKPRSAIVGRLRASMADPHHPEVHDLLARLEAATGEREFEETLATGHAELNHIEVVDTGHGMSLGDLSGTFLTIGTRSRRIENAAGARKLGDKGIGRLSTMRLGDRLRVTTSRAGETRWNVLDVDWTAFSHDDDRDVRDIAVGPERGDAKPSPETQGTTIRISGLLADWDGVRFAGILQGKVSRMVDPFVPGAANRLILARHNGARVVVPSIPKPLLEAAHAVCRATFRFVGDEPVIEGSVDYRLRHRKRDIAARGAEVLSLTQGTMKRRAKQGHAAVRLVPLRMSALRDLGSFSCEVYWFNRRVVSAITDLTSSMSETRKEIANWSGGPMLYRYGFRILPYGDPEDDWLGLDELAFSARGFKLNRQQTIGRVLLETPHRTLGEQTNREGLIETDVSQALQRIMMWIVHGEMRSLINDADELEQEQRRQAAADVAGVSALQERVATAIGRVREQLGDRAPAALDELADGVAALGERSTALISRVEAVVRQMDDDREKFVYLAGIGLMSDFIFHELDRAVAHAMDSLDRGDFEDTTLQSLKDQLRTLHKRIAAFDELAGERRQTKVDFDLVGLVDTILASHAKEFGRHGIEVTFTRPSKPFGVKAVRGMVIQIVENLVVNAAYWLKQQKGFEPGFRPRLAVALDLSEKTLTVEDNGPGVDPDRAERIFQAFVTTKPVGQGRGLGLYIARDLARYHKWDLRLDGVVGRERAGRVNCFVLDMG